MAGSVFSDICDCEVTVSALHQICQDPGVTATEALQLADDRPFWRMTAMA